MKNMRYEVDMKLSGKIDGSEIEQLLTTTVVRTLVGGMLLLKDEEYIEERGLTKKDLAEIKEKTETAKKDYLELLGDLDGITPVDDKQARFISVNMTNPTDINSVTLVVLKGVTVSNEEELLKFAGAKLIEENDIIYAETVL